MIKLKDFSLYGIYMQACSVEFSLNLLVLIIQ